MPTYQYACTECGHAFEQFQSFTDDALTECPECSGRLRKLFNAVGVVFKGSGFYRNDSRGPDKGSDAGAAKGSTGTDSSGSGSGEKKTSGDSSGSSATTTKTESSSSSTSSATKATTGS